MSNRRRKSTGQRKIAEKKMIRLVRGAYKHGLCLPGRGTWRDEYLNATSVEDESGKTTHHENADGRVLTDHALIVNKTRELEERVSDLAGKHYGWR